MKRKLNILFVSEYFYPRAAGGEVWSWELCKELVKRGHKVTVLTCRYGTLPREERIEGVRIMRPVRTYYLRPVRRIATMLLARHAERYVEQHKVDVIHVPAYTMNVAVSRIAQRHGIPCITAVHSFFGDDWRHLSVFAPFLQWLERRALIKDRSAAMHVPSAYLQQRIKQETGRDTAIIHNWLPERFPKSKELPRNALLFVGSLERVKDPLACVSVAKRLKAPLIVIGQGSLEQRLLREAARQDIALILIPEASHEETLSYLGGASLVLVPSVTESFSLVALEAVAQGTPVAGNPVGILPELPGVVSWPPSRVPRRLTKAQALNVAGAFAKERAIERIEGTYRRAA